MSDNLIARVLPYLPGTLIGGNGIDVVQSGTAYTISWNTIEAGFSTFGLQLGAAANAAAAQALLSSPLAWRNIIAANGGLEVWQRGAGSSASFAVGASTIPYTADRWYLNTGANQASTVAAVAGLSVPGVISGSRLAAKIQRNNAQTGVTSMVFGFPLDTDECAMIAGQIVALSFTAKAGANFSPAGGQLIGFVACGTGAPVKQAPGGYTSQTTPVQVTGPLTTTSVRFSGIGLIPSTTTQAEVLFFWTPVGTAGADDSFTVDDVQLEVGTFASPFERWPFERCLLACRRHFWKSFLYGTAPVTNAGAQSGEIMGIAGKAAANPEFIPMRYPIALRTTPTLIAFNPSAANAQVRNETTPADCSATGTTQNTTEALTISCTGNAGGAVGDILGLHITADAGI